MMLSYPKYVKLGHSSLRLKVKEQVYYRDAGIWEVEFRYNEKGELVSVSKMEWLNNKPLIEITEQEYKNDNKGYL